MTHTEYYNMTVLLTNAQFVSMECFTPVLATSQLWAFIVFVWDRGKIRYWTNHLYYWELHR